MRYSFTKKIVFLVIVLSTCLVGNSQDKKEMDSIVDLINAEKSIEKKLEIYSNYSRPFLNTINRKKISELNESLLTRINNQNKELFKLEADLLEAKLLAFMIKNDSAEIALKKILQPTNKKFISTYCKSVEMISLMYLSDGRYEDALKQANDLINTSGGKLSNSQLSGLHYVKGMIYTGMDYSNLSTKELLIADSLMPDGDRRKVFHYQALGENFGRLEDLETAEKYLLKAYELSLTIEDEFTINLTKIELGKLFQKKGELAKSDSILFESRDYFQKNYNPSSLYNITGLLARNNYLNGNYTQSILDSKSTFSFLKNDSLRLTEKYTDITNNYIALKNEFQAKLHLDTAYMYWTVNKIPNLYYDLLETKGKLAELKGNYQKALLIKFELDSLGEIKLKQANLTKANELKFFYETEKKEKENLQLKAENIEIEKGKQKQFYQLLIGIIFLTLGLIVLYLLFKNRQRKNEKLQELDTLKSKFFESISHELRTPLTLIQLPVSKALDDNEPIPNKELKTIKYNAKRLQNLMDDLLSITRIEANKYPLLITENNITEQASVLCAQFDSLAETNGIEYIKNIEPKRIIGKYDKEVFNKVLINLISNAIKYSLNNGIVEVNFEVKNSTAFLTVKDEGMGIKKEDQQYIFDKFYRVDQNNENIPGSGIGLSIVKELVELIGGSISFESEEKKGTQFFVEFPLEEITTDENKFITTPPIINPTTKPKMEVPLAKELAIDNADKPHLLIVEDNEELLAYIKEQFSGEYKVFTANNGKLGIEKGIELVPDLIISDWLMPEQNGLELCKAIKNNEITSHVPVIMLTAKTEVEDKIAGYETGADGYVAKPFEMNVLRAQVKNIIEQRNKIREKYNKSGTEVTTKEFSENDMKFWKKFKNLVEENISNPDFSIQTLSDNLFVSRMQLNRKVKALINQSGIEYITNQRIDKAKKLLANKDLSISEVSYQVGYDNVNSFSRAFKKETKITPSDFRKKLSD